MGIPFSAPQSAQAITTAVDLFHVTIATDKPVKFLGMSIFQTTDLGDAAEEIIGIGIYRGVTGGGSGSALTEAALNDLHSAPGVGVVGQGTASTGGTLLDIIGWNVRVAGPVWLPVPLIVVTCSAANDPLAFRLMAAPADSLTISATLYGEEGV